MEVLPILKVLSLFSGIGAFEKALERLNIDFELVNYCEIDKYASKAYSLIHNCSESLNLGDITKVDIDELAKKEIDIVFHGSPCQDFSIAGRQAGGDANSGTRSSLMWNTIEIVRNTKPKYVIWENVKNVLCDKHKHNFDKYITTMLHFGYNNYYKVLNAKDYGIPQNRERIFVVNIREDIDNHQFEFPIRQKLKLKLKDLLEDDVDEKYYLSDKTINRIAKWKSYQKPLEHILDPEKNISSTLTARGAGEEHSGMILIYEATKKGYAEAKEGDGVYINRPHQKRGVVQKGMIQTLKTSGNDVGVVVNVNDNLWTETEKKMIDENGNIKRYINSNITDEFKEGQIADISFPNGYNKACRVHDISPSITITTTQSSFITKCSNMRIRKLTPKECFRLMGFDDSDYEILEKNDISKTQLYKMAGNSIVVNVLEAIFRNLFDIKEKQEQINISSWDDLIANFR